MDQNTLDLLFQIKGKVEEARRLAAKLPDEGRMPTIKAWTDGLIMLLDGQIHVVSTLISFQSEE